MSEFRSYAPTLDLGGEEMVLSAFESHHLVGTNRAETGDSVVLFNGSGIEWDAELIEANRRKARLIRKQIRKLPKPAYPDTLAIGLIKGKRFDTILRQATELGVRRIQPLITERTQVRLQEFTSKAKKWTTQLVEACKQSGNPWLPQLEAPARLDDFMESGHEVEPAIFASLQATATPWKEMRPPKGAVTVYIGPEGDFSDREYGMLHASGAQPFSLGPYVLRTETAVVAALSLIALNRNSAEGVTRPYPIEPKSKSKEEN